MQLTKQSGGVVFVLVDIGIDINLKIRVVDPSWCYCRDNISRWDIKYRDTYSRRYISQFNKNQGGRSTKAYLNGIVGYESFSTLYRIASVRIIKYIWIRPEYSCLLKGVARISHTASETFLA